SSVESRMRGPHAEVSAQGGDEERAASGRGTRGASGQAYVYRRIPDVICGGTANRRASSAVDCIDGQDRLTVQVRTCADGSAALDPLHRGAVSPETGRYVEDSLWEQVDNGGCPEDPSPEVVLTVEEFRRLPLVPAA